MSYLFITIISIIGFITFFEMIGRHQIRQTILSVTKRDPVLLEVVYKYINTHPKTWRRIVRHHFKHRVYKERSYHTAVCFLVENAKDLL